MILEFEFGDDVLDSVHEDVMSVPDTLRLTFVEGLSVSSCSAAPASIGSRSIQSS
jgi:hypothetical protein